MNDLSNFGLNSCCQLYMLGAGLVSFVFVFQSVWDLVLKKSKRLNTVKTKKIRESTQFSAFVCVSACICICAWYAYVCVFILCVFVMCIFGCIAWLCMCTYMCVCVMCMCVYACVCTFMYICVPVYVFRYMWWPDILLGFHSLGAIYFIFYYIVSHWPGGRGLG